MDRLKKIRSAFEAGLEAHIIGLQTPLEMVKPMVYSLNSGGKRLRPLLLLSCLAVTHEDLIAKGMSTAIALEYIHTYSLIHDDLPAMDNDNLRRGLPTNHIQFNEATAILAGDGLLTDAFAIIGQDQALKAEQKLQLITQLSLAAGSNGMVAGQLYDIAAEDQSADLEQLQTIHRMKTGLLFEYAVEAAAIIAELPAQERQTLQEFARYFGLAYQIHNDYKDHVVIESDPDSQRASDDENTKSTYVSLLGMEATLEQLRANLKLARTSLVQLEQMSQKPYDQLLIFIDKLEIK